MVMPTDYEEQVGSLSGLPDLLYQSISLRN